MSRNRGWRESAREAGWWLLVVVCLFAFFYFEDHGPPWAAAVALLVLALGFWRSLKSADRQAVLQQEIAVERAHQIAQADSFEIRRRLVTFWPLAFTFMFLLFSLLAIAVGSVAPAVLVAAGLGVVCGAAWFLALRAGGTLARLTAQGIELGDAQIPWSRVQGITPLAPLIPGSRSFGRHPRMAILLTTPLAASEYPRSRLGLVARSKDGGKVHITLAHTREKPVVIYGAAFQFWLKSRRRR